MRASEGEELGCTPRSSAVLPTTYTKAHKLPAPSSSHHCIICRLKETPTVEGDGPAVQGAEGRWPQVVLESERGREWAVAAAAAPCTAEVAAGLALRRWA
jgi:hypothetical protein